MTTINKKSILILTVVAASLAFSGIAAGYNVYNFGVAWGTSKTYHIRTGGSAALNGWMITEIEEAAENWSAGSGNSDMIRGADWHFNRGSDVTTRGLWNTRSEVWMENISWFRYQGLPASTLAVTYSNNTECDLIFVQEAAGSGIDWTSYPPQSASSGQTSMRTVAEHEWGHCYGLDHDDSGDNTMNSFYQGPASDFGLGEFRIGEDESQALRDTKPHSSTGSNLALSRWYQSASGFGGTESWDSLAVGNWSGTRGSYAYGIEDVTHHSMSTSTLSNVGARWTLSPNSTCFDSDDYVVATRSYTLSSNETGALEPLNGRIYIWSSMPAGDYWLCAMLDYAESISEVKENDNVVRSEVKFTVQ